MVTAALTAEVLMSKLAADYLGRARRYEYDPELGWSFIPGNNIILENSNGEYVDFFTNKHGFRDNHLNTIQSEFSSCGTTRALFVGDSFAESSEVNIEDRFDQLINREAGRVQCFAIGCGGYGTDQQSLLLSRWRARLREGDKVFLLLCENDLRDVGMSVHSGRSKPMFRLVGDELELVPPSNHPIYLWRDHSYIVSRFISPFIRPQEGSMPEGGYPDVVVALIMNISSSLPRGVSLTVLAHSMGLSDRVSELVSRLNELGIDAYNLDAVVGDRATSPQHFLPCRHWTSAAHVKVAKFVAPLIGR